ERSRIRSVMTWMSRLAVMTLSLRLGRKRLPSSGRELLRGPEKLDRLAQCVYDGANGLPLACGNDPLENRSFLCPFDMQADKARPHDLGQRQCQPGFPRASGVNLPDAAQRGRVQQ